MSEQHEEIHLDVYIDRYELYLETGNKVYRQGIQNKDTKDRYQKIIDSFTAGFLDKKYAELSKANFANLDAGCEGKLRSMVDGVTSEVGRALVGLTCLQLAIKCIAPEQNIRLHKGSTSSRSFSWEEGISMRSLDKRFNTPFLRKNGLLKVNGDGVFMTRSLAENYPYSRLYKAEMRGPFTQWMAIVDAIEENVLDPNTGLSYILSLLKNRSDTFIQDSQTVCELLQEFSSDSFEDIKNFIISFYNETHYSARAFEISIHALYQAMDELNLLEGRKLIAISQMRSANKKHGNVGDIELMEDGMIVTAWDAKYGKPYLREELDELREKLLQHPEVRKAGFICNSDIDLREDICKRKKEIADETGTEIEIIEFDKFIDAEIVNLESAHRQKLGFRWLTALVESFAQRRLEIAPIDEPCDAWVTDLIERMLTAKSIR